MSFQTRKIRGKRYLSLSWKQSALILFAVAGPLMRLRKKLSAGRVSAGASGAATITRAATITFALLVAIIMLLAARQALSMIPRFSSLSMTAGSTIALLPKDENGITNILLLGEGDNDHEGIDLTDTVMIVSLDTVNTKSTVMLSLPRDLYVLKTEKMGAGRINTLYRNYKTVLIREGKSKDDASKEALTTLARELGSLLNIPIYGVMKLNFSGFEQAIDAIGGIEIEVPEELVDTEYPGPNDSFVTFAVQAGMQHFDGATALKYARSRHTTSDFSRSARQQQIIVAAVKKVKENGFIENVSNISRLVRILSANVESTFSLSEILAISTAAGGMDASKTASFQLSDRNGLYESFVEPGGLLYAPPRSEFEGASVLLPIVQAGSPLGSWRQLALFTDLIMRHRTWFTSPVRVSVLNAGARSGAARLLAVDLIRYGFTIAEIGNFEEKNLPDTSLQFTTAAPEDMDENGNKDSLKEVTDFLASTLAIDAIVPALTRSREGAPDIVIILGKDFDYSPLSVLLTQKKE